MDVPTTHSSDKIKTVSKPKHGLLKAGLTLLIVSVYVASCLLAPLPKIQLVSQIKQPVASASTPLRWPKKGQSAIGALGYGVFEVHGDDKPQPTASVAKVLTALAVLKQKPLLKGEQGPVITITAEDVATYQKYADNNGSLVPVQAGEQLSEYQALQALLLPSANNIADLLVKWAFGSESKYVTFSNSFIKSLGLEHTTIADASGFSPKTVSTAHDLMLLGENVMDNPVLAEIVGQTQATIPVAGVISNVNLLLGHNEIVGIKTGNTDEAGGCYLFAAKHTVEAGHEVTIIGVTMGAQDLATAIDNSLSLLQSSYANFRLVKAVNKGDVVGQYIAPWGGTVGVTTTQEIRGISWSSHPPKINLELKPLDANNNQPNGQVSAVFGRNKVNSPIILAAPPPNPSIKWRLTHPVQLFR